MPAIASATVVRPSGRVADECRAIEFVRHFTCHAEGSVLTSFGQTRVLCNATVELGVPRFLQGSNQGWLTAEYSMLPRATHGRVAREAARGKQSARTVEIQRLIGRSLRAAVDLNQLAGYTITLDCDVLQADGGTRTAAISGAYVALYDALLSLQQQGKIKTLPIKQAIAAVSVGIYQGVPVVDLDYPEDANCETDMNVVMTADGQYVEIQGTAEGKPFSNDELQQLLQLASQTTQQIFVLQQQALGLSV